MGETLQDEVFGSLGATPGGWDGAIEWRPGQRVGVSVCREEGQDIDAMLAVARRSLEWLRAHEPEAAGFVADRLLELYNDSWTDASGPLDREGFLRRVRLSHVLFCGDGSVFLTFDDGGLFGGHEITTALAPDKGWWDCSLVG
jgi:hypothetical protein